MWRRRGALLVVVLFEAVYQVTLFVTPGLFTTDIFSYVMYGHISAFYNLNPYIYPPNYFPGNPMLDWIHPIWHDQPTVYGPLWTDIDAAVTGLLASGDMVQLAFAYKVLGLVSHLVIAYLIWWIAGRWSSLGVSDVPPRVAVA